MGKLIESTNMTTDINDHQVVVVTNEGVLVNVYDGGEVTVQYPNGMYVDVNQKDGVHVLTTNKEVKAIYPDGGMCCKR